MAYRYNYLSKRFKKPDSVPNRHDVTFRKFFSEIRNGRLKHSSELLGQVNLTKNYDFHKDDEDFEFYHNDLLNVLHYSVFFNQMKVLTLFVQLKISVNARTLSKDLESRTSSGCERDFFLSSAKRLKKNDTPLHIACREGHRSILFFLLEQKEIDIDVKNVRDEKPEDVAKTEEIRKFLVDFRKRKEYEEPSQMDLQVIETNKKWDQLRTFLCQQPIDFSEYCKNKNKEEEFQKLQEKLESLKTSLDQQLQKLQILTRIEERKTNEDDDDDDEEEEEEKIQPFIPRTTMIQKTRLQTTTTTNNNNNNEDHSVGSYIISVCKEINIFNPFNGKWVGSYDLPEEFGTKKGITQFPNSIWKNGNTETKNDNRKSTTTTTTTTLSLCNNCQVSSSQFSVGDKNGKIFVIDLSRNRKKKSFTLEGHSNQITSLSSTFDPSSTNRSSNLMLSGSYSSLICLWDIETRKHLFQYNDLHSSEINDLLFHHNRTSFASASSDGFVKLVDLPKNEAIFENDDNRLPVRCLSFGSANSPHHNTLFSGGMGKCVRMFDLRSHISSSVVAERRRKCDVMIDLGDPVTSICCSRQQQQVVVGYGNGNMRCLDLRMLSSKEEEEEELDEKAILWDRKSYHGSQIINKIVNLWTPTTSKTTTASQNLFASCGNDGFIKIGCFESGKLRFQILETQPCYGILNFSNARKVSRKEEEEEEGEDEDDDEMILWKYSAGITPYFSVNKNSHGRSIFLLNEFRKKKDLAIPRSTNTLLGLFAKKKKKEEEEEEDCSEKYAEEFVKSLVVSEKKNRKGVLDGRIFKFIDVINTLKVEKQRLMDMRIEVNDKTRSTHHEAEKKLVRAVALAALPIHRKFRALQVDVKKLRSEFISKFQKNILNFSKREFFKRTTAIFQRMIQKEKTELQEIRTAFSEFQKTLEQTEKGLTRFASKVQNYFSEKRILTAKFKRREDLKLKYSKSEFSKLKVRVEEIKRTILPIHEKIIKEYSHHLIRVPAFSTLIKNNNFIFFWDHEPHSRNTIGVIENFQLFTGSEKSSTTSSKNNQKKKSKKKKKKKKKEFYFGETRDGIAHGNGVVYKEGGRRMSLLRGKCYTIVYEGEFKDGVKCGKGIQFTDEKIVYEGLWRDGRWDGPGISYDLEGKQCVQGNWTKGELTSSRRSNSNIIAGSSSGGGGGGDCSSSTNNTGAFDFEIIHYDDIADQLIPSNELGAGANGVVYGVEYEGKECAAKIMDLKMVDRVTKSRIKFYIRRSLRLCASFDHPNVIKVFGMISGHENKIGYVMEKCSHSVSEEMFRKNLSFKEKILVLFETARGMWYLHERNIMNRDLKWDNVLIRSTLRNEVVLTDFDTAKEDESIWKNSVQNTASSVGTPVYIAPEVLSKKYGLSVDVYSFGIMIHALIFNLQNPYSETEACPCGQKVSNITPYSFPYHIKTCNLRPVIDEKKRLSMMMDNKKWLLSLMKMCYSTNPLQRPSFTEIVAQFEKRMNNMVEKRVRIFVKGLEDEPPEVYIMLETSYDSLCKKIMYRWRGSVIVQLFYLKRMDEMMTSQQQRFEKEVEGETEEEEEEKEEEEEEEEKEEMRSFSKLTVSKEGVITDQRGDILIPLHEDEEFVRLMSLSNVSTIVVEFEKTPETEKGKLRKELQELADNHDEEMTQLAVSRMKKFCELEKEKDELGKDRAFLEIENEELRKSVKFLLKGFKRRRRRWRRKGGVLSSQSSSSAAASSSSFSSSDRNSVVLRFRPYNVREKENTVVADEEKFRIFVSDENVVVRIEEDKVMKKNEFLFDRVFDQDSTQEDVFRITTIPCIRKLFDGSDSCVMAYGNRSSGKTFTMYGFGDDENEGIIPRSMGKIFREIELSPEDETYTVLISFYIIHGEKIYDLIRFDNKTLSIREDPWKGIHVSGISEHPVTNKREVLEYIRGGHRNLINRIKNYRFSFEIFTVTVTCRKKEEGRAVTSGRMSFVDCASSGRVDHYKKDKNDDDDKNDKEIAQKTNVTLSALGNCVHSMSHQEKHVRFRESKLTLLLSNHLRNCVMIINCSKHYQSRQETISSLKFGVRVKSISSVVVVPDDDDDDEEKGLHSFEFSRSENRKNVSSIQRLEDGRKLTRLKGGSMRKKSRSGVFSSQILKKR